MTLLAKQHIFPGVVEKDYISQMGRAEKSDLVSRIIDKNPKVFRKTEKSHQKIILNRLGWIDCMRKMPEELQRIENMAQNVKEDGLQHVFVLGMGGSSLYPEVLGELFGRKRWLRSYTIVDTTAPSQLESIIKNTDLEKSFFIVSSKSGTTVETMSQFRFFFKLVKALRPLKAGRHFAAITDEGSYLHRIARRNRFREIFLNSSDIGGRYSALSYFGLVPGAFTQADLTNMLSGAEERLEVMMAHSNDCDALKLGTLMGICARKGIDKLRFRTSPKIAPFIVWIEQLVAESTGKEWKGIIPIEGNLNGGAVSDDYLDVLYSLRGEELPEKIPPKSSGTQRPRVMIEMTNPVEIGGEILKWEMATAIAANVLGVNPFDEPNVAESKKNAEAILHTRRGPRKEVRITPLAEYGGIEFISAASIKGLERRRLVSPEEILAGFFSGVGKGDYVAFLCYSERTDESKRKLAKLRRLIESKYNLPTLRDFGPRFLHSTGQLFKGGSRRGHFVVMEREYETDFDIPGRNISFGRLIKAQAQGDIKALRKRKRPVIDINLKRDPIGGLDNLIELIERL